MSALTSEGDVLGDALALQRIREARERLSDSVETTPLVRCHGAEIGRAMGGGEVFLKLELFQRTGSFKVRAALLNIMALSPDERAHGVTAVSAGNHAVSVACAAQTLGVSAKLVVFSSANPLRLHLCRSFGAEIVLAASPHEAFELAAEVAKTERRALIHPFEGILTALGTATVGLELSEQSPPLDAVIVPIGGGGLAAGVSAAIRQCWPSCRVYGVEPMGANTMHRSLATGSPQRIDRIDTIADSLGPPAAMPISFELCQRNLAGVVLVSDAEIRAAMRIMQQDCKLAVEPAGATALAALLGPLRDELHGKRVALIVCGSNIDTETYLRLMAA